MLTKEKVPGWRRTFCCDCVNKRKCFLSYPESYSLVQIFTTIKHSEGTSLVSWCGFRLDSKEFLRLLTDFMYLFISQELL